MYSTLIALAVFGLASLNGVQAQVTATVLPGGAQGLDGLHGEILGTGADGTTYLISATAAGIPITVTLVEGATHLSEDVVAETGGVTVNLIQECDFNSQGTGTCTQIQENVAAGATAISSAVSSGPMSFAPVPLATAKSAAVSVHHVMAAPVVAFAVSGLALLRAAL